MLFKEIRKKKNLSRARLGALLGVSGQLIYRWENGTCEPQLIMLPKLAEIFETDLETILRCFGK